MKCSPKLGEGDRQRLSVAVVQTSARAHGLNRYASVLAAGLVAAGVDVDTVEVRGGSPWRAARAVARARRSDVVHLQFADRYLGSGLRQLGTAVALRLALLRRPVVVTAHDFHTPRREVLAVRRSRRGDVRARLRRRLADGGFDLSARLLLGTTALVLTCSRREQELSAWTRPRRSAVVPHYVEAPADPVDPPVGEQKIVVAGFIHARKGQAEAVAALPWLPGHQLVLAGSANDRNLGYLAEVQARATALGVADRVRVTGFLSEAAMTRELRSARLALAPYRRIAASGSIATLIGAGVPLVARASDYTEELARECPRAVHLFAGDDPAALAAAVGAALTHPLDEQRAELAALSRRLSPRAVAEQHRELYRSLTGVRAGSSRR